MSQSLNNVLIAPFATGLDTDVSPWLAPSDSFSELENIHIKHGYLQKRQGYRPFGSLIDTVISVFSISKAILGVVVTDVNHGFDNGDIVYFTGVTGMTEVNNVSYTVLVISPTSFSIGVDTSSYTTYINGGTIFNTTQYRVMGISRYIEQSGAQTTIAYNARRAFRYDTSVSPAVFSQLDVADIFSSGEFDYVWTANWQSGGGTNRLYFTNGKAGTPIGAATVDGIRYYDGTTDSTLTVAFNPVLSPVAPAVQRKLDGGKLIFSLGQRLIVLHTYEYDSSSGTTKTYPQRARWSAKQNHNNWNDVVAGGGGYTDAATGEQIISARALQNQIIVFFTNSVWALTYTSDANRAFKWQKINSFRACDGKMASVGYDRYVTALGIRGITATDGVETKRIDDRISDFTIDNINVDQFQKVFCERSYAEKKWWTLFNGSDLISDESNGALIYDDDSKAFSTYEINLNCLGYGNFSEDYALDDFTAAKDLDLALDDFDEETLLSYFWQNNQETFLGGDISGKIYILETDGEDDGLGISSKFITNDWNPFKEEGKESQLNYIDFYVDTHPSTTATISFYKDTDVSPYVTKKMDFLPNLNFLASISNANQTNPVEINAIKHGLTTGDNIYIYGVTGMIEINSGGTAEEYTVTVTDGNNFTLDGIDGTAFADYEGYGGLYLRKFYRNNTWKRVYAGGIGFQHRMKFESDGIDKPFRINGYKPVFKKRGVRNIN